MVSWQEFAAAAPELARLGRERFDGPGLCLVGSVRKDGSARISPVDPFFFEGDLYLGMMWQSKKALDLVRDPRCLVHSIITNKDGREGEFKLRGRAIDTPDPATRQRYGDAVFATINWRPDEPYHLFRLDIENAAFIVFDPDGGMKLQRWPEK